MALLDGFTDNELHEKIVEALKVLARIKADYDRQTESVNGQYLKALEASHDGGNDGTVTPRTPECDHVLAQIAAVRAKF